jgi:uncharacterized protein YktA (UPF0223 family)
MAKFFEFIELNFTQLTNQINRWLQASYNKAGVLFNSASPYGQILQVMKELFTHNIIYLKNAVNQINLENTVDERVIRHIARIAGHNPSRSVPASGTLKFKLKGGVNIADEFGSLNPLVRIPTRTRLRNKSNNLEYIVDLGATEATFSIIPNLEFRLPIKQGRYQNANYTGDGLSLQSISVNVARNESISEFDYTVLYNSIALTKRDHLWDMLPRELEYWARTGFNGGLDIYFGNQNFGFIPTIGSNIRVEYLLTNGSEGEISNLITNDWKVLDPITDANGKQIKMEDLFDIIIEEKVGFASDGETALSMKQTIPYTSRNLVLATPQQFVYHLSKLNMFSVVDAFNSLEDNNFSSRITGSDIDKSIRRLKKSINNQQDYDKLLNQFNQFERQYATYRNNTNDNQIWLYLIPRIDKYLNDEVNYFNVPMDVFYLDETEQQRIISFLERQAIVLITTELQIIQPIISKYVIYIYVRILDEDDTENIKQEILAQASSFFLANNRSDRIVRSDLISSLNSIDGVDSVDLYFLSKKNEDYHRQGLERVNRPPTATALEQQSPYNPNKILGIDPVLGDILLERDEYPLIRGGWRDRNDIYYNDNPDAGGLNSVNIIFKND